MEEINKMNRGIIVSIYESKESGNCSNDGISNRYKDALLVMDDERSQVFDEDLDKRPTIKIIQRNIRGRLYLHAEPIAVMGKGGKQTNLVGFMSGGAFIYSCDSRFPNKYPISLHDRQETPEEYDIMSK